MPSRPIQSPAPGFLSLLALKNTGLLPAVLPDHVQPILDMLPFYEAQQRIDSQQIWTTATIAASNSNTSFWSAGSAGPLNDRMWIVTGGSFFMTMGTGDTVNARAALIARRGPNATVQVSDPVELVITAAAFIAQAHTPILPHILMPGQILLPMVDRNFGPNGITLSMHLQYIELLI